MIATLMQHVRHALRSLAARPGFAFGAVLTLSLGIGVNAAIFSVINVVLLKPLPYGDPDRLVMVWTTDRVGGDREGFVSYPDLQDWRTFNTTFQDLSAFWTFPNGNVNLTGGSEPERVPVARALSGYFELLGTAPLIGRTFLPEENIVGNHRRAVLSYGLWQRRFGGDTAMVDQAVFVNGFPYTVVGVMPPEFRPLGTVALGNEIQLWRPLAPNDNQTGGRGSRVLRAVGRLRDGVTMERAQADLDRVAAQLAEAYPDTNRDVGVRVVPLTEQVAREVRPALLMLMAAAGLVLLVACVNVAGLMLVRAAAVRKQLAIQSALGASRSRIMGRVLTESLILGMVGAVGGAVLAVAGVRLLVAAGPEQIPLLGDVAVDGAVLAFGAITGVVTGLLFGLVPALQASRQDLANQLRDTGRAGGNRRDRYLAEAFVVAEVALALVLLVSSGLLIRSFQRLLDVDPGMDPTNVLTFQLELPMSTDYPLQSQRETFFNELLLRLEQIPGVASTTMASGAPVSEVASEMSFTVPGIAADEPFAANFRMVAPGYFATLKIPLLSGRTFITADRSGPRGVVISASVARRVWTDSDPVNDLINVPFGADAGVIGVVGDVNATGLDESTVPTVYLMSDQWGYNFMTVIMRTVQPPDAVVSAAVATVKAMDGQLPVYNIRTMEDIVSASVEEQQFQMLLLGTFSGLALFLAIVGTYTVVSSNVNERTLEFSIRTALGAQPRDTLRLVVYHGARLAGMGVIVGGAGAFLTSRVLAPFLFETSPMDPAALLGAPLFLIAAAIVATIVPARRAVRVEPMATMRAE